MSRRSFLHRHRLQVVVAAVAALQPHLPAARPEAAKPAAQLLLPAALRRRPLVAAVLPGAARLLSP